jgi:hypothetical protein
VTRAEAVSIPEIEIRMSVLAAKDLLEMIETVVDRTESWDYDPLLVLHARVSEAVRAEKAGRRDA